MIYAKPESKRMSRNLLQSQLLAALIEKATDEQIKASLSALHNPFTKSPVCAAMRKSRTDRLSRDGIGKTSG
jgi:hypothetical protein